MRTIQPPSHAPRALRWAVTLSLAVLCTVVGTAGGMASTGLPPTTTVITHGFSPNSKGIWVQSMLEAMLARNGGVGRVYRYLGSTGVWTPVPEAGGDGSHDHVFLIFNWVPDSASPGGPNWRYTQAAGDALAAMLRDPAYAEVDDGPTELLDGRAVHFLGHSRGACVISEAIRRLALAGIPIDQMTTLDPHPADGTLDWPYNVNWGDPTPVRWSNVAWADNYWRADGGGFLNGLDFDGIPLDNVFNVELDETALACCGYSFEHLDVHLWYHGTVDTAQNPSNGEETITDLMRDLWYPDGWEEVGYFHSVLGGGAALRPTIPDGVDPVPGLAGGSAPLVFNGWFEQGTRAGWQHHGGTPASIVNVNGNWVARLNASAPALAHNRAYLPKNRLMLAFDVRRVGAAAPGDLLRVALQRHDDSEPLALDVEWTIADLPIVFETLSTTIPADFGGRTSRLRFFIDGGAGGIGSTVELDEIEIVVLAVSGDLNGDGLVDGADLGILLASWGACPGCAADLNGDGSVDGADLGLLLSAWAP